MWSEGEVAAVARRDPATATRGQGAQTRIGVRDLRVAARIGAHPHEYDIRQMLRLSVAADIEPPAHDDLGETLDYRCIVSEAEALASEHVALIETFVGRLAQTFLRYPGVLAVEVAVEKPGALPNGIANAKVTMRNPASSDRQP